MFPKPISQEKHTFTNQTKCTTTQNKHKKTKARFSRLLRHPAWKRRGPILILALHKFGTYLLRHLSTCSPGTHMRQWTVLTPTTEITHWPHPFLIHCQRLPRERKLLSLCWLFDSSTWYNVNIAQQLPNTSHAVSQCKITLNQWVLNKIKSPKSLSISSNTTL